MKLHHVSERGDIERFEPRAIAEDERRALVWAVDDEHLVNYLLPRECPRVCFRLGPATTASDRKWFLGVTSVPVVAIEALWLERASTSELWAYQLPTKSFEPEDRNAGYFVSRSPVVALACRRIDRPLLEAVNIGAEIRVVSGLHSLAAEVAQSTLSFSCIRMRNAAT